MTGPRTVATLQGVYELTDTETQATVALYDRFREFCAEVHGQEGLNELFSAVPARQ